MVERGSCRKVCDDSTASVSSQASTSLASPFPEGIGEATLPYGSVPAPGRKLRRMRVVALALVAGLAASFACASGFERNGDDDSDPRIDAPFVNNGDGGQQTDARIIDAPGQIVDAPTDAPTTGGVACPNTQEYNDRALAEVLFNPNWVPCTSGAECSSAQCCYEMIVCVAYP